MRSLLQECARDEARQLPVYLCGHHVLMLRYHFRMDPIRTRIDYIIIKHSNWFPTITHHHAFKLKFFFLSCSFLKKINNNCFCWQFYFKHLKNKIKNKMFLKHLKSSCLVINQLIKHTHTMQGICSSVWTIIDQSRNTFKRKQ